MPFAIKDHKFKILKEKKMWIFTSKSFLSIVADKQNPKSAKLLVRARVKGDIEEVFTTATVQETPDADYRFRAWIDREEVKQAFGDQIERLGYSNFKSSVSDTLRLAPLMDVWQTMYSHQESMVQPRFAEHV